MRQFLLAVFFFCCCSAIHAQQVFFRSAQVFDKQQLELFYSSVTLQGNLLLFNGNDYQLYAYDRSSGRLQWQHSLGWKSNRAPFFVDSVIWAQKGDNKMIQLDRLTGQQKGSLALHTVETPPLVKNNIAYATGIYDGGCLFAYDLKADTVLWHRFLAHGCSVAPYYLSDRIMANVEGNNWLEIGYDGRLSQPGCDTVEVGYPSELPCTKKFALLTHDQREISEDYILEELSTNPYECSFYTTSHHTFVAGSEKMLVFGDKRKEKTTIHRFEFYNDAYEEVIKIVRADETTVWVLAGDQLVAYNYKNKKIIKTIDLGQWHPHCVLMDGEKLWLISRKDGLLYGMTL